MKRLFFIFLLATAFKTAAAQRVHAFLLCSTADKDRVMREGSALDHSRMKNLSQKIAKSLGYGFVEHTLSGLELTTQGVNELIDNILPKITKKDIVIFYYSGHGFLKKGDPAKFPNIFIPTIPLASSQLHKKLLDQKPKFIVTLIDACSNYIQLNNQGTLMLIGKEFTGEDLSPEPLFNKNKLEALFSRCDNIMVTAAQPGFKAVQTEKGSYFTRSFLEAFNEIMDPKFTHQTTWESILAQTKSYTEARTNYARYYSSPRWIPSECDLIKPKSPSDEDLTQLFADFKIDASARHKWFLQRKQWYKAMLTVTAQKPIDSVVYFLDATMPHPVVTLLPTKGNIDSNFEHDLIVYGQFPIKTRVYFKDGTAEEHIKDIKF